MALSAAVLGGQRPGIDGSLAGHHATAVVGSVALPFLLGGLPEVREKLPTLLLVPPHIAINRFMADEKLLLATKGIGDLIG